MKVLVSVICAALALALAACGGGGTESPAAEAPAAPSTSAVEVERLIDALREDEAQKAEDARIRDECGDSTPFKEYDEECAEPWADMIVVRLAALEAVVNELKSDVGMACRKALEGGNPYIPLDAQKISKCSQDVGAAP
jgi:hypothetical protein